MAQSHAAVTYIRFIIPVCCAGEGAATTAKPRPGKAFRESIHRRFLRWLFDPAQHAGRNLLGKRSSSMVAADQLHQRRSLAEGDGNNRRRTQSNVSPPCDPIARSQLDRAHLTRCEISSVAARVFRLVCRHLPASRAPRSACRRRSFRC
jgi:hypothetical protein